MEPNAFELLRISVGRLKVDHLAVARARGVNRHIQHEVFSRRKVVQALEVFPLFIGQWRMRMLAKKVVPSMSDRRPTGLRTPSFDYPLLTRFNVPAEPRDAAAMIANSNAWAAIVSPGLTAADEGKNPASTT